MKEQLLDLLQHTHGLGVIDTIRINGSDEDTKFYAMADDGAVYISGEFDQPITVFNCVFGMPNISKLKTILNFSEYDATSKMEFVTTERNGVDIPNSIHFETANGDFVNDFRLMSKEIAESKVKSGAFPISKWDVIFSPSDAGIARMKKQISANSDETTFIMQTEDDNLKMYFGNASTHAANFIFQSGITGTLKKTWHWPVKVFLAIVDLPGEKSIKMSDQGVAVITVKSSYATYTYSLPALIK